MRTFDEIRPDISSAVDNGDVTALLNLATELDGLDTPPTTARACALRGIAHYLSHDLYTALDLFNTSLVLHQELDNKWLIADLLGRIGNTYNLLGEYPAALDHYTKALAASNDLGDRSGIASVTGNIGTIYYYISDFPAALSYFNTSLVLQTELGNLRGVASSTGNIGNVYYSTNDYNTALKHYHQTLALNHELGDRHGVAHISCSIGRLLRKTGDYASALEHLGNALAISIELGDTRIVAEAKETTLEVQIACRDIDHAWQTLSSLDELHIDAPQVYIAREISRSDLQILDHNFDAAEVTLTKALEYAADRDLRSEIVDVYYALRNLAQQRNDFAAYIEYNNQFTRINEEINGKDTAAKLAMEAKQREIDAREREHEKQLAILHSTLPKHIADRVARGEVVNDHYDNASVIFLDIVGFTDLSSQLDSRIVIQILDDVFTKCDAICARHNVTKIKTIGDSYMAVAFGIANSEQRMANVMPSEACPAEGRIEAQRTANPAVRAANAAMEMMSITLNEALNEALENALVRFRIGIHSGTLTAGVIGTERLQYDVWGDTVNVASRMESTSEPGRIHISQAFATLLPATSAGDSFEQPLQVLERGTIEIKGKGLMHTFWLE